MATTIASSAPEPPASFNEGRHEALRLGMATAVERAIVAPIAPPNATTPTVRLLGATLEGHRATLDFSRELLDYGLGSAAFEQFEHLAHRAAADELIADLAEIEFTTLIEGIPLERWFETAGRSTPPVAALLGPEIPPGGRTAAPLAGRRVALSPGHGYYLNDANRWVLQREFFQGIVEDFVNQDFVTILASQLAAAGADIRPTRNLDRSAGNGLSGFPRWQEAARYHLQSLGAPANVWNEPGFNQYDQDIRCRPLYANFVGADLLVSLHNNGGGGTGTETLYDNANSVAAESKRLADLLHAKVITAIRRDYDASWTDRRVQGFNGSYGENRLATRPSVIIEIAFMDRPVPDNAAIQDDRFKRLVVAAIAEGITEFLDGPVPAAPDTLIATADTTGISLVWVDRSANESGFRIERWNDIDNTWARLASVAANITAFRDATAAAGRLYRYRVLAFNDAGSSSQASNEVTAATLAPALALAVNPATAQTRDWNGEVTYTLNVTDPTDQPINDATILVRDLLRNSWTTLTPADADGAGRFTYRTSVPAGQTAADYTIRFQASRGSDFPPVEVSRTVVVANAAPLPIGTPTIASQLPSQTIPAGANAGFAPPIAYSGTGVQLSYQWFHDGAPIPGASFGAIALNGATTADAGTYSLVVTTPAGSATTVPARLTVTPGAWLSNVSLRTNLPVGQSVTIGFVVDGGSKPMLVRAAGPSLAAFGLTSPLLDPRIEMFSGAARVADNNDWAATLAPAFAMLGAFTFAPASRDAAVLQTLAGPHSAQVSGVGAGTVLVELYDAGAGSAARLINLSARNHVGTGADQLIAGFFVSGTGSKRVLVRAVGPTLAAFGVTDTLTDPQLEVRDGTTLVASNNDWGASLATVFAQVGAFALPAGSRDAALVATLSAGRAYTAQLSGVNNTTGEALIEIYELQ